MNNKFWNNLKRQCEENPAGVLGFGVGTLATLTQLGKMNIERKNSKTWRKEVNRRVAKTITKK